MPPPSEAAGVARDAPCPAALVMTHLSAAIRRAQHLEREPRAFFPGASPDTTD